MENMKNVEELLLSKGFLKEEDSDTWINDIWTIRFMDGKIEVFDEDTKYLLMNEFDHTLEEVLDEI
jgi:hypothetical protein